MALTLFATTESGVCGELTPQIASVPAPKQLLEPHAARPLTEETLIQAKEELRLRQEHLEKHHLRPPLAKSRLSIRPLSAKPLTLLPTALNSSQTPLKTLLDRILTISETGAVVDTTCEPSIAVRGDEVLVTGNWFASFSANASSPISTFKAIRPGDFFPPPAAGIPFCCDQLAIYDRDHDLMMWLLQYDYKEDGDGNFVRIAVAKGDDIKRQKWRYYDLSPGSIWHYSKEWFDYPAWALTRGHLYITTNSFATCCGNGPPFSRAVAMRIPLDKLAAYQSFDLEYFDTKEFGNTGEPLGSLCPTQGGTDTMYLGAHVDDSTLRVYTWSDAGKTVTTDDVNVQTWSQDRPTAPNPQGGDWLVHADDRITAGWVTKEIIGFGWTAARDVNYHFPHVRMVLIDPGTKKVIAEPHIYSDDFAYAYPAASPNGDGEVGITLSFGGNTTFPSSAIGVLTHSSSNGERHWELATSAAGKAFPPRGNWGDYLTVRVDGKNPKNWVAASFVQDNNGFPQVSYHVFTLK